MRVPVTRNRLGALLLAVFLAAQSAPTLALSPRIPFSGVLTTTDVVMPAPGPGSDWVSDDMWHVRGAEVNDAVTGEHIRGTLERAVSFNLDLATGDSSAWCAFVWRGELDTWRGACRGSLVSGSFNGQGVDGTILFGAYELAPGGTPAIGPYLVSGEILHPGGSSSD